MPFDTAYSPQPVPPSQAQGQASARHRDPAHAAALAQQAVFRHVLNALSYPGRRVGLPSADGPAWWQALSCLVDAATDLADVDGLLSPGERLRLGVRTAAPGAARFVLADAAQPPAFSPCRGTLDSPEGGATLVLRCAAVGEGQTVQLSGPGIQGRRAVALSGVHPQWWSAREGWNTSFPQGVDLLLADEHHLMALPRTTRVALPTSSDFNPTGRP